jgi:hypothetical protein
MTNNRTVKLPHSVPDNDKYDYAYDLQQSIHNTFSTVLKNQ